VLGDEALYQQRRVISLPPPRSAHRVLVMPPAEDTLLTSAYVSLRQLTSAYVSIRQLTSAYVSIRQHTSTYVSFRQHT
jgi:hypothetical protein